MTATTWQLTYTTFGNRGMRSMREQYKTRQEAEAAVQRYGITHYEIWRTTLVTAKK